MEASSPEPRTDTPSGRPGRSGLLVLASALLVGFLAVLLLHDDSGATWDESVQAEYGALVLEYFRSGGEDQRCNELHNLRSYGPLYELLPPLLSGSQDFDPDTRHFVMGLIALLALPLAWGCGVLLRDEATGAIAMLAIVTLPRFVGHAFTNSKDVPLAVASLGLAVGLLLLMGGAGPTLRKALFVGVAFGLALAARPGAFPILLAWLLGALGAWWLSTRLAARGAATAETARASLGRVAGVGALVLAIGWLLMVLPWPWAHGGPLMRPLEVMASATSFPVNVPVLFEGEVYWPGELPLSYLPKMLLFTTPLPHVLLAAAGAFFLVRKAWRSRTTTQGARAGWFVFVPALPLIAYFVARPTVYDGIRHFLFLLPFAAVLAAVGARELSWLAPAKWRPPALAVLALTLLAPAPALVSLHPYQTAYFNVLVAGLPGAEGRFDTEYWLASHGEAIDWINARATGSDRSVHVLIGGDPTARDSVAPRARERVVVHSLDSFTALREAGAAPALDYVVVTKRQGFDERIAPNAPVVHEVGRQGVVFTVVKGAP